MCAAPLQCQHRIPRNLALEGQTGELRLRRIDVLVHVPQAGWTQWYGSARSSKWAQIIRGHSDWRESLPPLSNLHPRIVRLGFNHAKRKLAEVLLLSQSSGASYVCPPLLADAL